MHRISRRQFASNLAVAAVGVVIPRWVAAVAPDVPDVRSLRLAHLHTGEGLEVEYFDRGVYLPDALRSIDHLLRDFRTGDVHAIDPPLLDLLHRLTMLTETRRPFEVISGYRSPATNQKLRSLSEGVAAGSLHMVGQAIDIRLPDVPLERLRQAALAARGGGVGYYRASNFVHVDTGRIRAW